MTNGSVEFRVRPEEVKTYLEHGFRLGRNPNNKFTSPKTEEAKNRSSGKGKLIVHNNIQNLRIDPEDLEKYLADGWKRGYLKSNLDCG